MSTRQYIGARYVIKVYENSQNPNSAEWEQNTTYEPLTMVTYNNSSYLSKKEVPPTIGDPAQNPTYWVITGAYNGQIANLQNQIDTIEDVLDSISAPVSPYFTLEQFGGVANDPNTDNSLPLKQAILAANANGGGHVLLKSGIYYCSTPITFTEHLYCVKVVGSGSSYNSSETNVKGTSINYTGIGDFIHFANGIWKCSFADFDLLSEGVGTAIKLSNESDPDGIARSTNCIFENMCISFQHIGVHCSNAAYLDFDRCVIRHISRNDDTANTDVNPIGMLFDTNNEYVTLDNCVIIPNQINEFNSASWSTGLKVEDCRHLYISNFDVTDCDQAIYLAPPSGYQVSFVYANTIDVARVHYGIHTLTNTAVINDIVVDQFIFTAEETLSPLNRIIKLDKTSGGYAYAVRGNFNNISPRTGGNEMEYWVEADNGACYSGHFEVNFISNLRQKVNFGDVVNVNRNFGVPAQTQTTEVDLNDYKYGGIMPFMAAADSANGVGHIAMIMNYANDLAVFQVAIPIESTQPVMYRIYSVPYNTWSTWHSLSFT